MSEERLDKIKENVYIRCSAANITGIGMTAPDKEEVELIKEIERLNNIISEINSIVEYWGYDKEHNDISSLRMAMKNIKDVLGSDKE